MNKGKPERTNEYKLCMRAARHLNASRVAWVANRFTPGIEWQGSSKGRIIQGLLTGRYRRWGSPISPDVLAYALATQPGVDGTINLTEEMREQAERELAHNQAKARQLEKQAQIWREKRGRPNYAIENHMWNARRRATDLKAGIEALGELSEYDKNRLWLG